MIIGDGTTAVQFRQEFWDRCDGFLWICHDTPILDDGQPDIRAAISMVEESLDEHDHSFVVLSTQLRVGACDRLAAQSPSRTFAVIPENFRATGSYLDRLIVGTDSAQLWELIRRMARDIPTILTTPRTAEMTKHAINGFLALSIEYAQELALLADKCGVDPDDLAKCIMSDPRIGEKAYLKPSGDPGPHLIREVHTLAGLGGGPLIDTLESLCSR